MFNKQGGDSQKAKFDKKLSTIATFVFMVGIVHLDGF